MRYYENVLTLKEMQSINVEDYKRAQEEAKYITEKAAYKLKSKYTVSYKKEDENLTINSIKNGIAHDIKTNNNYNGEETSFKLLLASILAFDNAEWLIDTLLKYNITYERLSRILTQINYLKSLSNAELVNDRLHDYMRKICMACKKNNNEAAENGFVINRLESIVVFEQELYLQKEANKKGIQKTRK